MTFVPSRAARTLIVSSCALIGMATGAHAQLINIDFDDPFGVGGPTAATYGAAGTPGTWNQIDASVGPTFPLVDKAGAASTAVLDIGPQMVFPFSFQNNVLTGDHGTLLQDLVWSAGALGGTLTITGMANGSYDVLTYAYASDNKAAGLTDVNVLESTDGVQTVGGALWPGAHTQGITYSKHKANVTQGAITITVAFVAWGESINGIQIEQASVDNTGASDCDCSGGNGPCFNVSGAGRGCPNSNVNGLGAALVGAGNAGTTNDTFSLSVTDAAPSKPGLILSGTASLGPNGVATVPDSAGILCVAGQTRRGAVVLTDANGAASFPDFQGAPYSASDIVAAGSPISYTYWFRDPGTSAGCTGDTASSDFNFTNGWTVTWQ